MAKVIATHERIHGAEQVKASSARAFGFVAVAVFVIIGLWPVLSAGGPRYWSLGLALVLAAVAIIRPGLLEPFNRLWMKFGALLHRVMTPIVLTFLFYAVVTPTGVLMRLAKKDPLGLRLEPHTSSYWILRQPPGPAANTMKNQF